MLAAVVLACSNDSKPEPAFDTSSPSVPEVTGAWQQRAPLPTPRSEVASAVLDGRIYVIGGYIAQGSASSVVEAYDATADRWQRLSDLPAPRDHAMAAALNGKVYVFGGNSGNEANSVFAYDVAAGRWSRLRDMPVRRAAGGAAVLNGRIVLAGGTGDAPADTYVYNPEDDTWTKGSPIAAPREHLAMTAANNRVYLVGGRWTDGLMSTNEVLDDVTGGWQTLAPLPTARGGTAAGSVDGKVVVAGGEAFDPTRTFPQVEVYDPASDTWSAAPNLPTPRHGLAVVGLNGVLYVIGGGPIAGLSVDAHNEALRLQ